MKRFMKKLLLLINLISFNAQAEVLFHKINKGPAKKIKITKLNGFHVNDECLKNKAECLSLISNLPKMPMKTPEVKDPRVLGNPASDFCSANNGSAEILQDKRNNEYEYCVLKEKYLVDSWDFYSLNKK